ncbi:hypothetical protein [Nannocystis pusilla]|uniref:hypothetical protein n=1 Tax=Nannocystis pusilla TaxID=889268 RepID=UPI003B766994
MQGACVTPQASSSVDIGPGARWSAAALVGLLGNDVPRADGPVLFDVARRAVLDARAEP